MANTPSIFLVTNNATINTTNSNRHIPIAGTMMRQAADTMTITESSTHFTIRTAGTFSNMYVRVSTNAKTLATPVRFRKNSASGNLNVSVTGSTTGIFEDIVNSDTVAAGDEINYRVEFPNNSGNQNFNIVSVTFLPSADTAVSMLSYVTATINLTTTTRYQGINGFLDLGNATETNAQTRIQTACTMRYLFINLVTNTSGTVTVRLRKNGANGNSVITSSSATSGLYEDTSNTDSIAAGDDVNFSAVASTSTGTRALIIAGITMLNTSNKFIMGGVDANNTEGVINFGTTNYLPIGGRPYRTTTEDNTKMKVRLAKLALSNLTINITANTVNASSTVRTRKNGANGAQSVTIGASTTGVITDATNIDSALIATDDINYQIVTGGASGNLTMRSISTIADSTSSILVEEDITEPSISVDQTLSRLKVANRSISESAISVAQTLLRNAIRPVTESAISASETLRRPLVLRVIADSISVNDSLVKIRYYFRNLSESAITVSQTLSRGIMRPITEGAISVNQSLSKVKIANRSINESSITVDAGALTSMKIANRVLQESVSVAQTLTKHATKVITESAIIVSQTLLLRVVRTIAEEVDLDDSLTRLKHAVRNFIEPTSVADTLSKKMTTTMTEDAIEVDDEIDAHILLSQTVEPETVTVGGGVLAKVKIANRIFFDFVTFGGETMQRALTRVIADSISVNQTLTRVKYAPRIISDDITVDDDTLERQKVALRPILESVDADDTLAKSALKERGIEEEEIPNIADNLEGERQKNRFTEDEVEVEDTLSRQVHFFREVGAGDNITVEDLIGVTKIFGNEKRSFRLESVRHKLEYIDIRGEFSDNPEIW